MRRLATLLLIVLALVATACTPEQEATWWQWFGEAEQAGLPCTELAPSIRGAGLPDHFAYVIERESQCQADAVNASSGALGLTQILPAWLPALCGQGIACVPADLLEPRANLLAAAYIFAVQGPEAWSQTW